MRKTQNILNRIRAAALAVLAGSVATSVVQAQYTAVWYDSFNVSMTTNKTSFEYNNGTRQSGVLAPIGYTQSCSIAVLTSSIPVRAVP